MISGLLLQHDFLSEQTEHEVLEWLDSKTWSTALSRRTQHYGYEYNYKSSNVKETEKMSGVLLRIADKINDCLSNHLDKYLTCKTAKFDQCIVNEYTKGQKIAPHIDSKHFGPVIVSISLNQEAYMTFTRGNQKIDMLLPRRSILILTGEARYEWQHSLRNGSDNRRISLTFRTVKNELVHNPTEQK